jgi:lipopolysaccharide export system permease protein
MQFSRNDLKLPQPERRKKKNAEEEELSARRSADILFSGMPDEVAEMHWRISPALAAIVLGLLAIPLSHSSPREGRGGRALLGILAYTVYANVLYMSRGWLSTGHIPPILGMWWVHLLVLVIALLWLRRQGRMVGKG